MGGNMSRKVKDRVYACKQGGTIELNLDDCDLAKFPTQLLTLKSLESLDLSHNHIPNLSGDVCKLKKLHTFKIGYNEIEVLPPAVYKLKVKIFDCSFNLLSSLPEGIEKLSAVEVLLIGGNAVRKLPSTFNQLSNLRTLDYRNSRLVEVDDLIFQLTNLKELRLNQNQIPSFPEGLTKLSQLEILDLGNNLLNKIPDYINKLAFLKQLHINNNHLTELPATIAGLVRLEVFNCGYNQINDVKELDFTQMHQMIELRFNNNLLTQFNRGVGHMKRLAILDLTDNQITSLPREIGWLYESMRQLLVSGNKLQRLPGDICFLNPTVKFEIDRNPLLDPFSMLIKNKYTIVNIKPLCTTYFKAFPNNCIATGDAVNKSIAGIGQRFFIEARDISGNARVNGKDNFRVFFTYESADQNGEQFTINGIVKDLEDGTYQVAWNNKKAGFFYLHIQNEGDHIRNSPFTHLVLPGPTNPANCKIINGFNTETPTVGVVNKFTIVACDQFDNEETTGGEPFFVNIQGGNNPIPLLLDLQNGKYEVQWTPAWPATYQIEVGYDGYHIQGSPFVVNV